MKQSSIDKINRAYMDLAGINARSRTWSNASRTQIAAYGLNQNS